MPLRLALAVGINYSGGPSPLPGSMRTASDLGNIFKARGFSTRIMLEQEATRANLSAHIGSMLTHCVHPDDLMVIAWSGHAAKIAVADGSTVYCLVPYDAGMSENWSLAVPTYQWAAKMAQRSPLARLFTLMDVCFSAGFRGTPDTEQQDIVMQGLPVIHLPTVPAFPDFAGVAGHPVHGPSLDTIQASGPGYVSFHPSGPTEESAQMNFGGIWRSLFSEKIRAIEVQPADRAWSYQQVFAEAKKQSMLAYRGCTPQCFGDAAMLKRTFLS